MFLVFKEYLNPQTTFFSYKTTEHSKGFVMLKPEATVAKNTLF